jgi:hypothetical protein
MDFSLGAQFTSMLYLTEQLGLNFLEGSVIELVSKQVPTVYRYQKTLARLRVLMDTAITLTPDDTTQSAVGALVDYDAANFNQSYAVQKIVHLVAHARQRSTLEKAQSNYRAASALIAHLSDTLEMVEMALPALEANGNDSDDTDDMTLLE